MKVLLLGPTGQLGYDICRAHAEAGEPFELVPIRRDLLDVAAKGETERFLGALMFDAIINCTSFHNTDEVEDNAALAFAVNAHGVQTLASICAAKHARLIHVNTDYVFGGNTVRDRPLGEEDPIAPVNVYGASKRGTWAETLAQLACKDVAILRVASLFGVAGASGKGGNFVETMVRVGRGRVCCAWSRIRSCRRPRPRISHVSCFAF